MFGVLLEAMLVWHYYTATDDLYYGSSLVLAAMIGWVLGAIGGMMALPCASLIARASRGGEGRYGQRGADS